MEFTVPMSLVDFIPVICFAVAAVILQRDFYEKMSKGPFALFAAGTIDVICAGGLKALYKLLYAAGVCDFQPLSNMFFPVQSIGFLLAGLGMLAYLIGCKKKGQKVYAVEPFTGTFVFVGLMVSGLGLLDAGLIIVAAKKKKPLVIVMLVFSFIFCLGMGYLSSKNFEKASMNWIAEGVNVCGQLLFMLSAIMLHKAEKTA